MHVPQWLGCLRHLYLFAFGFLGLESSLLPET